MESLSRHLLESPVYVYAAGALAETLLLARWYLRRTRGRLAALAPVPVLVLGVALIDHFIQTDRERIAASLKAIAAALERHDVSAAAEYLDPACRAPASGERFLDREELIARARRAIATYGVRAVSVRDVQTEVSGAIGTTRLTSRVTFGGGTLTGQSLSIAWVLQWARRPAGWRIVRVEVTDPPFLRDMPV
jgi:ketosteroid isomerase-like protein